MRERVARLDRADVPLWNIKHLLMFWAGKTIADIGPKSCRDYVDWRRGLPSRNGRGVSIGTARRDLEMLRAALHFWHDEHALTYMPKVRLPEKPRARERWLTRDEAARLLMACWRNPQARHVARIILIGLYSGTRSGAILRLRWLPSTDGGWIDLEHGRIYRRASGARETRKRQPPAPIHARLAPHLRRWRAIDAAAGVTHVINYQGGAVRKLRRSWRTACKQAGLGGDVVPHTLRHTAATWLMQSGLDAWQAAGYLGMSVEVLEAHYGHHHTDYLAGAARAESPRKRPENHGRRRPSA